MQVLDNTISIIIVQPVQRCDIIKLEKKNRVAISSPFLYHQFWKFSISIYKKLQHD